MKGRGYVFYASIVAALGGFLFGFDTAVISGAEKSIQVLFQLSGFWHGLTVAMALIGTVIGALLAGKPADVFGRKQALIIIAILYMISALGSALTSNWYGFMIFRFLGGLGVGASSVIGPMYIAEIAHANLRGRLVGLFQFNIVTGILVAFFSNYLISQKIATEGWRYMLGVEAVPALIFLILLIPIPATPRWLVIKDRIDDAKALLQKLATPDPEKVLNQIIDSVKSASARSDEALFQPKYRKPIMLAFLLAFFNQMSGINAIMYFAPRIFEMAGFSSETAMFQAVSIGATNLVFTIIAMSVIDFLGRKKLLIIGSLGMILFLGIVALNFLSPNPGGIMVLISLVGFIAFFGLSQGAVIWVYISEIFPNRVRAKGQAFGSFSHWFMAALISWLFPVIAEFGETGGGFAFLVFSVSMMVQLIVVKIWFPETKGKSLEEIQKDMIPEQA